MPSCLCSLAQQDASYKLLANETGLARCPFDPRHNNTALYAGLCVLENQHHKTVVLRDEYGLLVS